MSRHHLTSLVTALLFVAIGPATHAASFTVNGNDTTAKTLAPASGATETGTVNAAGDLNLATSAVAVTITGGSGSRSAVINNSGKIRQTATGGTAARAVRNNNGGATITLNNSAGALIQAADADAIQISVAGSSVVLDNSGSIVVAPNPSAGGNQAVDWNGITSGSNQLFNRLGGLLSATAADGVRPGVNGLIDNAGTIQALPVLESPSAGVTQASSSDGVDAQTNSGVTITNSGSISGRHGITGGATTTADFTISVTNQSGGVISGVNGSGINIDSNGARLGNATVINNGSITGNFDVAHYNTGDGDGVDVDGICTLTNNGIIRGLGAGGAGSDGGGNNPEGVSIGGGTVTNNAGAEITGQNTSGSSAKGHGLLADDSSGGNAPGATTISNAGLIRGYDSYAIRIVSSFANSISNDSSGTIRGGGNIAEGAAIQTTTGVDTLSNRGAIVGDNGLAVDLGDGDDVMHILGGSASITGDVSGGAGNNSLDIDPGAGNAFSYSGALANFASVEIKSGTVNLAGASSYSGTTTISGGTLSVANGSGSATGSGNVVVNSGALLTGSGSVASVSVASGGTVAPGSGRGTLSVSGDLAFAGGAQFSFELGSPSDLLNVASALNSSDGGTAVVNIVDAGIVPGIDYVLIRFGSTNAGSASFALGSAPATLGASLEVTPTALILHSPKLSLSASSLSFGPQVVNTESAEQTITVSNVGTGPLQLGTPAVYGADSAAFQISSNGCSSPVPAGGNCLLGIRFAPWKSGSGLAGLLLISSNAASSPDAVNLSGDAVDALYRVDANTAGLAFGNQPVGTTSAQQVIQLRNSGNSPITISGFSAGGDQPADFAVRADHCSGQRLDANDSCLVSFTFTPAAAGNRGASETVLTSPAQTSGTTRFTLSGTGTQPTIGLAPASLAFGSQVVGSSSLPQAITLSNTGNSALTLTSISVSGAYAQSNHCGSLVAAGGSCEIDIVFMPNSTGLINGTLLVISDAVSGMEQASLVGNGIQAALGTSGALDFGSLPFGTSSAIQSVTVSNTGSATLTIGTPSLSGAAAGDFVIAGNGCTTALAPSASCSIGLRFAPTVAGARSASLLIPSNAPGSPASVGLSGTGLVPSAGTLGLVATTVSVEEGPGRSVVFQVSRSGGSYGAVTLHYATSDGSAQAGRDYTAVNGSLSWADGDTASKTIAVPVIDNHRGDGSRSFTLSLSAPTGNSSLGSSSGTGTITDDDRSGLISFDAAQVTVADSVGQVSLVVHRGPGIGHAVSVHYATQNLTALAGTHYTAVSGDLHWAAGDGGDRVILVPITAGALGSGTRLFNVHLSAADGGALLGLPSNERVTIQYGR